MRIKNYIVAILLLALLFPFDVGAGREAARAIRSEYEVDRAVYIKTRSEFKDAQGAYTENGDDRNRQALEVATRNHLEAIVQLLISRLESVKSWVDELPSLDNATRESIAVEIDADISWLTEIKIRVKTDSVSSLSEELTKVRKYIPSHKKKIKRVLGKAWVSRLEALIVRFDEVSGYIDERVSEKEAEGADIARLIELRDEYRSEVEAAREQSEAARELFLSINETRDADELFSKGKEIVSVANEHLQQAHFLLKEIRSELVVENPS